MRRFLIPLAAAAMALPAAPAAVAAVDHDHRRGHPSYHHGPPPHAPAWGRRDRDARRYWSRGDRMPRDYYADRRYWADYRTYRLPPPPRGYQYVRIDGRIYLTETRSGLISRVIAGLFN